MMIHLNKLEEKIQKAATIELALLNKAAELKEKRRRWVELYNSMNHPSMKALIIQQRAPLEVREYVDIVQSVKNKVRAFKRKEKALLFKSTGVCSKRQELTELYQREERILSAAIHRKPNGDTMSPRQVDVIVVE